MYKSVMYIIIKIHDNYNTPHILSSIMIRCLKANI